MKKLMVLGSFFAVFSINLPANANDPTQNAQTPEYLLQAICKGNGHIGTYDQPISEAVKASGELKPPFRRGNSLPENYKIADMTYQNLSLDEHDKCKIASAEMLTQMINRQLEKQ